MSVTRRQFLSAAAVVGGAGALTASPLLTRDPAASASALPNPATCGVDHVVVVMMENRSFDHFLGWLPGADGRQAGLSYTDRYGAHQATHHLTNYASCGHNDPDHSYEGGRIQFNNGRADGWLRAGEDDILPIGYFEKPDLGFLGRAAPQWTVCDRYFSAVMAETYPNRFYLHSAQTDRTHNSTTTSTLPTIWDRLAAASVSARYYYSDVPFLALWGAKYLPISRPFTSFLTDAATGQLPSVSVIDPRFLDEASGSSADDHPHADIRAGEEFLNEVYQSVTTSPNWSRTMLVITYDEWGGFYDHVAPTTAPDVSPTTALRGFRVPTVVISPRARRGQVAHNTYDHTSVLKAIEWRWGLSALTPRDTAARNLAEVLDFSSAANTEAPAYLIPPFVATACAPGPLAGPEESEWSSLKTKAAAAGWSIP
ncbi:alkaline phosphatase family protein [Lapillicoccus sp.]|uniref:alkaline phosphatase family protein n=1 Tax=Lapillicoccus sp. TaxID=1909287 RepID=UPI0039831E9D